MKNFRAALGVAALSVAFVAGAANAQDEGNTSSKKAGTGPNPYVDCGIGAALFPTVHWAAVISNATWDLGTTAVISATASPETCSGQNVQAAKFIIENYEQVVEETARGDGEHVAALMKIMSCNATEASAAVPALRAGVAEVVTDGSYGAMSLTDRSYHYFSSLKQSTSGCAG